MLQLHHLDSHALTLIRSHEREGNHAMRLPGHHAHLLWPAILCTYCQCSMRGGLPLSLALRMGASGRMVPASWVSAWTKSSAIPSRPQLWCQCAAAVWPYCPHGRYDMNLRHWPDGPAGSGPVDVTKVYQSALLGAKMLLPGT
jgi:hypothetical protein